MGNACGQGGHEPKQATGEGACPFTTLYWDFLDRHEEQLGTNRRLQFQYRNLQRKTNEQRVAVRDQAARLRERMAAAPEQGAEG